MNVKQKFAGSNPTSGEFSVCSLIAVVGFVGTGGRSKIGGNPRKVTLKLIPLKILVQSAKSGCKRTGENPLSFHYLNKIKKQEYCFFYFKGSTFTTPGPLA